MVSFPTFTVTDPNFGQGWLSRNAADLIRICVQLGGYPEQELCQRVALAQSEGKTNIGTVERVLDEMYHEALAS